MILDETDIQTKSNGLFSFGILLECSELPVCNSLVAKIIFRKKAVVLFLKSLHKQMLANYYWLKSYLGIVTMCNYSTFNLIKFKSTPI